MLEAECARCGETFIPDGPDDLEHIEREDGARCGGQGVLRGEWVSINAIEVEV